MIRLFKNFLFILFLTIVFAVAYSWVNLWLPKSSIGLYYVNEKIKPQLILPNEFKWDWKRIIPKHTSLITISTAFEKEEQVFSLPLAPIPKNIGSDIINDRFLVNINVIIEYALNSTKIIDYVDTYYNSKLPISGEHILRQISNQIRKDTLKKINSSEISIFPQYVNLNTQDLTQSIESNITSNINKTLEHLPITVFEAHTEILSIPDLVTYNKLVDEYNAKEKEKLRIGNLNANLSEYIEFLSELGTVVKASPVILELVKVLPPKTVMDLSKSRGE